MKKILIVVGTRPNFVKITQFPRELAKHEGAFDLRIVHTGQHFDDRMSNIFFEQFGLRPDVFLGAGQATPVTQMANIMLGLEKVISDYGPDLVIVPGDVNSTMAAAVTANKMGIRLAHLESGLRSFDRGMPEEYNRIVADELADLCFVTEQSGMDNLLKEGKAEHQLHLVGNTMIDTLVAHEEQISASTVLEDYGLEAGAYILMTMHRPSTVDHEEQLVKLLELVEMMGNGSKVVFPAHPRTLDRVNAFGLVERLKSIPGLVLTEPLDYFAFQQLIARCQLVLTDSGGIQEETTHWGVPCATLRDNTERPITLELGTNKLFPIEPDSISGMMEHLNRAHKPSIIPLWDDHVSKRILDTL